MYRTIESSRLDSSRLMGWQLKGCNLKNTIAKQMCKWRFVLTDDFFFSPFLFYSVPSSALCLRSIMVLHFFIFFDISQNKIYKCVSVTGVSRDILILTWISILMKSSLSPEVEKILSIYLLICHHHLFSLPINSLIHTKHPSQTWLALPCSKELAVSKTVIGPKQT